MWLSGYENTGAAGVVLDKRSVSQDAFRQFADRVQRRIADLKQAGSGHGQSPLISDLERLDALRRSGTLTEDEFQAAKRKLLGL